MWQRLQTCINHQQFPQTFVIPANLFEMLKKSTLLYQQHFCFEAPSFSHRAQNFAELGSDSMLVSIAHTGHMSWEPGILTKTICEVNIGKYPFDFQSCEIKFLTWMHTNKTLDVQPGSDSVGLDACIPNGEWDITQAVAEPYFYPSTYRPGSFVCLLVRLFWGFYYLFISFLFYLFLYLFVLVFVYLFIDMFISS